MEGLCWTGKYCSGALWHCRGDLNVASVNQGLGALVTVMLPLLNQLMEQALIKTELRDWYPELEIGLSIQSKRVDHGLAGFIFGGSHAELFLQVSAKAVTLNFNTPIVSIRLQPFVFCEEFCLTDGRGVLQYVAEEKGLDMTPAIEMFVHSLSGLIHPEHSTPA